MITGKIRKIDDDGWVSIVVSVEDASKLRIGDVTLMQKNEGKGRGVVMNNDL